MKTWKLVSGILSIVFFVLVSFQSCALTVANAISRSDDLGSFAGFMLALLMLSGGIVSISTRNIKGNGGNIATMILYGLATFMGLSVIAVTAFADLIIWSGWCGLCTFLAFLALFIKPKQYHPYD